MSKSKKPSNGPKPSEEVIDTSSKGFGQKEAEKLAASYLPKNDSDRYRKVIKDGEEVNEDKFDVVYVTSDKNVFFKQNEGEARSHAKKQKLEIFKVKNDE